MLCGANVRSKCSCNQHTASFRLFLESKAAIRPRQAASNRLLGRYRRENKSTTHVQSAPDVALGVDAPAEEDTEVQFSYGRAGLQGPRDGMEDYTSVIENGRCGFLVASVFDGHSGPFAAEWLSTKLYEHFSDAINEDIISRTGDADNCEVEGLDEQTGLCCPLGVRDILAASFEQADRELLDIVREFKDEDDRITGSTATVALVRSDKIIVANVGDSRAVLSRQGQAIDLTTEHRVFGESKAVASEIARVNATGGWVVDGRVCDVIAVSRAFGDSQFKEAEGRKQMLKEGVEYEAWDQEFADGVDFKGSPVVATPDVTEIPVTEHDEFLIVASDGLWDVMNSKDVVTFARGSFKKKFTAQQIADKLTKVAVMRHTLDNVSVVVIDLGGGPNGWGKAKKQPGLFSRVFRK